MKRNILLAATLAAGSLIGFGSTAFASPAVVAGAGPTMIVQTAPPPPLYEAVPGPRAGYVWAPGNYVWRGDRYVWNSGHWLETRPGYAWQQPHWERQGDSWYLVGGNWVRTDNLAYNNGRWERGPSGDRDHDGIDNRYDRDRDGDGVANRYDDYPNDPNRN